VNPVLRILKNSTALSLAVLLERGIAFFLPWYVARVRGSEVYGGYSTAMTFVVIAAGFAFWGLDQLVPREIARSRERAGSLLASSAVLGGVTSLVTAAVVLVVVTFLDYAAGVRTLITLGVAFVLLPRTEATLCEATVNGLERMEWIVAVRFPAALLRIGVSILVLSRGWGMEALLVILAATHLIACGAYLAIFVRFVPGFRLRVDRTLARSLAVQAIPLVVTIGIGEGARQLDRVFLSTRWDVASVGFYSTGIMLVQLVYMLAPAVMNALYPVLSRAYLASRERFAAQVSHVFRLLFIAIFPLALAIVALADVVILFAFGEEYVPSIAVLRIYALGIVPSFLGRLMYRTLLASNNERLTVRIVIVNSVTIAVLNLLLVPRYGVRGAALAAACAELVGLVQNLFYVSRSVGRFAYGRALARPASCVLVSAAAFWAATRWEGPSSRLPVIGSVQWALVAGLALSLVVFVAMLFISRTITRDDRALLGALRHRPA
jgi:O-antigen/teichoic acid export membrane protein